MSIEQMQTLLLQMQQATQDLQSKIHTATEEQNPYSLRPHICCTTYHYDEKLNCQDVKAKHYKFLNYKKNYTMITFTFDPSISKRLSEYEQIAALTHAIRKFDDCQFFCCFEKHMNGILHAHLLTVVDPAIMTDKLHAGKSRLTPSRKLMPAIKPKLIPQTELDINRTYNYIFDHKKDHPVYKHLIINI